MTRKSKRDLAREIDDLDTEDGDDDGSRSAPVIVYETDDGYVDGDGDPVPTDDDGNLIPPEWGPIIVFEGGHPDSVGGETDT